MNDFMGGHTPSQRRLHGKAGNAALRVFQVLVLGFAFVPQIPAQTSVFVPADVSSPGQTVQQDQTTAPGTITIPLPGQTIPSGQSITPGSITITLPGQVGPQGQIPVPGPGQAVPPGQSAVPGQTVQPGQIPVPGPGVPVPGQVVQPRQIPAPSPGVSIPGQVVQPGQAVPPGQIPTSGPGIPFPGQAIQPGQSAHPGASGPVGIPLPGQPAIPLGQSGAAGRPAVTPGGAPGTDGIPIIGGIAGEKAAALSLEDALQQLRVPGRPVELRWDPFFGTGVFTVAGHNAAFDTGNPGETGYILLDFREIVPVSTPFIRNGLLWFPEPFIAALKRVLDTAIEDDGSRFRIAAIIVDPGHGGKDAGAVGNHTIDGKPLRVVEKDITLAASRLLRSRLSAAYTDKRVLLTRDGDTYPSLEERVAIANSVPLKDNEAIIFISIHANASFNRNARGFEVWYLSPEYRRTVIDREKYADSAEVIPILNAMLEEEFTTESVMMAQALVRRVDEALGSRIPSRGIKAEEWFVVKNTRMPSVLVELGFVSNEADALLMTDETYLRDFVEALYKGIEDFITAFEGTGGFTAIR